MQLFEKKFKASLSSNVSLLDKIMHYIIKRKGKKMRPMFIFLSAKLCGKITESSYTAAFLIELLHTATLVHDDVVDESNFRRGFFSINALWKNKIAVLVGDFLLSRGLLLAIEKNEIQILKNIILSTPTLVAIYIFSNEVPEAKIDKKQNSAAKKVQKIIIILRSLLSE